MKPTVFNQVTKREAYKVLENYFDHYNDDRYSITGLLEQLCYSLEVIDEKELKKLSKKFNKIEEKLFDNIKNYELKLLKP